MICLFHQWSYSFPDTLSDFITIDDEALLYLALSLKQPERICQKCGKKQVYEPPQVCGGSKWMWFDAGQK
ncbi:MAG: hypothetical protein WBV73_20565 [Phormidium sp.]